MKNPNFLILDEPTNDLDLMTLNLLEDFLMQFEGCLVIVSHDRYFMDKLVDHLFVFEGDGKVRDFPGNYSRYREAKEEVDLYEREQLKLTKEKNRSDESEKGVKQPEASQKPKARLSFKEQREFEELEKELEKLENEKEQLTQRMNNNEQSSHEELLKWANRLNEVMQLIEAKTDRWLELSEYA
jgi:ATP-binding cassette subfamily F protein uup